MKFLIVNISNQKEYWQSIIDSQYSYNMSTFIDETIQLLLKTNYTIHL